MRLMSLIKLVKLKWVWPLLIPFKKNQPIPGIPIDVVAVNYAVFAISI
jgi:hypothetical protein